VRHGRDIIVGHNSVADIMRHLGLRGLPNRRLPRGARVGNHRSLDLVRRNFRRNAPNELWMTDNHRAPHQRGKVYCCVVLDAFSRAW
jgi:transposase InsO family protein